MLFPQRAEALTIATFALVPVLFRLHVWNLAASNTGERFLLLSRFPCAMDYFAWGMLYCYLFRRYRHHARFEWFAQRLCRAGLILLPVFFALFTWLLSSFGAGSTQDCAFLSESCRLFICFTAFALLFVSTLQSPPRVIDNQPLRYIGLVSYEFFLFHAAVIPWVRFHLAHLLHAPDNPCGDFWINGISFLTLTTCATGISFGLSAAIYHCFSQPLLKWLRKY